MGIEGIMVIGAFAALVGTLVSGGNIAVGILLAMIIGALAGLFLAFACVTLRANQTIIGVAISSMIGWSVVAFLLRMVYGGFNITCPTLKNIDIPVLSQIPVLGPSLFGQNILTYVALFTAPFLSIFLYRTKFGLKIRATGENPRAAETGGIHVFLIRYLCFMFGSAMAALGGAAPTSGIHR